MAASNRRRFPRVKPKQLATRVRSGDDLHIGLGIENISMGGIFVRSNTPLKVGRGVTLEIQRAGASQPLVLDGKVTSSLSLAAAAQAHRAPGMGISFDPLPPHIEQRLEGLIVSIDPSAMKLPASQKVAKAPVLEDRTHLVEALKPSVKKAVDARPGNQTFVPGVGRKQTSLVDQLMQDVADRDEQIRELEAENKKLRQRLLNLVNRGN